MASLEGSPTKQDLIAAFAGGSQANGDTPHVAQKAGVEGRSDLAVANDPATGLPIGRTGDDLKAAATGWLSLSGHEAGPGHEAGSLYND
jgi:hypothetical protein